MARFDDPSKFFDQLEDGIDAAWSEYVQEMQGQLSSRAPIDTGRLASSFFISEGVAVFSQRPASGRSSTAVPARKQRQILIIQLFHKQGGKH